MQCIVSCALCLNVLYSNAAGEGRDRRLADIAKCDAQAEALLKQAEAVPLTLVSPVSDMFW